MANWGILKENENLYIIINGMRARNIKNGEEHGPIEHIDHERNSDELWIHFRDEEAGKRINRKMFKPFQGQFLELENALSNAAFIDLLREHGITKKRKNVSTKSRQSESQRVVTPSVDNIEGPRPTVPMREFKKLELSTLKLTIYKKRLKTSDVDQDWVAEIKSSIRQAPGELVTKVPVMIPLNVATDPYQFQESMLDGVLYLIGGNHVVKACKELLEEEKENEEFRSYSNISADVFLGLSPEQAKMIGNHHNRKTTTKKVLFQV
nr:uncharacterized protein LOC117685946 [Crassostrea gigas]